jgi:hypothetical protein
MSTQYRVCLVVTTESATLSELTAKVGVEPDDDSHNMGDPNLLKTRGPWKQTVWRVGTGCSWKAKLEEQFEDIVEQVPPKKLRSPGVLPDASKVYLSVGVFSDDQIPTADLTLRCLAISQSYGASIEVCMFESDMSKVGES